MKNNIQNLTEIKYKQKISNIVENDPIYYKFQ